MKKLIARIQKDISKLQDAVHKEGNDLIEKIKKLDLKSNLDQTKDDLMKLVSAKLKKIEPTYHNFVDEVRKNAKKAGIEIEKFEKNIKAKAKGAKKNLKSLQKKTSPKAKVAKKRGPKKKTSHESKS